MGDVGYFDAAGYLHVLGRSADRVLRQGGQWLNPREVEEVAHHPPRRQGMPAWCSTVPSAVLVLSLRQSWRTGHDWQALEHDIAPSIWPHKLPADHCSRTDVRIVRRDPAQLPQQDAAPRGAR